MTHRWTLLLVSDTNGLVGPFGDRWSGHPEHYERVDVVRETHAIEHRKVLWNSAVSLKHRLEEAERDAARWQEVLEICRTDPDDVCTLVHTWGPMQLDEKMDQLIKLRKEAGA
jgi:hypothetical protein